ncbi:MAG: trypsin-like peptidase domain-containing protein [Rhodocyclaceae bacterium]|nr:trypsin-like peptidase domain-containing protein [Rhodocyclaceae bacterium]
MIATRSKPGVCAYGGSESPPVGLIAAGRLSFFLALVAVLLLPARGGAQLVDTIARVKPSVVAIGTYERTRSPAFRFLATGFVIADGNTAVTNAHAVPVSVDTEKFERLVIAVPAGDGMGQIRNTERTAQDDEHDLAVLRFEGPPLATLELADDAALPEGSEVAFTGFPIGSALGLAPVTHRGIVSAWTPISIPQGNARRLDPKMVRSLSAPFRVYQLDATAYPGNSGSPLYDARSGEVVGIINMVFVKSTKENVLSDPSGITYAIPVRYLRALLAR